MTIIDVTHAPVRRPGDVGTFYRPQVHTGNPPGRTVYAGPPGPVQIVLSGPFFAVAPSSIVAAMLDEMRYYVAAQALADVAFNLDRSLRNPTPYYETQIILQRRVDDWVVHDRGVAYGPWLEGVSSRNRTTRFKGYASFRRAVQSAGGKAPAIIARVAQRFVDRWNR